MNTHHIWTVGYGGVGRRRPSTKSWRFVRRPATETSMVLGDGVAGGCMADPNLPRSEAWADSLRRLRVFGSAQGASWRGILQVCATLVAVTCGAAGSADAQTFEQWRLDFIERSVAAGQNADELRTLLDPLRISAARPPRHYADRDYARPPFALGEYVAARVAPARIAQARAARAADSSTIDRIAQSYGVDAVALVTVWSLESNCGTYPLRYDAVESVASLAFLSRRRDYFEAQLLALVQILRRNDVARLDLASSFDGGLGQPQFMPEIYLRYAVDGNGDGRRDIWRSRDDALASIANYLRELGWQQGAPLIREVSVAPNVEVSELVEKSLSIEQWAVSGVLPANALPWSVSAYAMQARLDFPTGVSGPAFLTFANFESLRRYNGTRPYAYAASFLAEALGAVASGGAATLSRPFAAPELPRKEMGEFQKLLAQFGFDPGLIDGQFGPSTLMALRAYQRARGLPFTEAPTLTILTQLRAEAGIRDR